MNERVVGSDYSTIRTDRLSKRVRENEVASSARVAFGRHVAVVVVAEDEVPLDVFLGWMGLKEGRESEVEEEGGWILGRKL